ncbi:MAG: glycosyltransferase family A protein [Planctomycetota bacterium]
MTVLIPAYNLSQYLPETLNSVLAQSYENVFEIIVWDDGSTDDTHEIAIQWSRRYPKISVRHHENQGRAITRQSLLDSAQTEVVGWIDADDLAVPTWLEEQVGLLIRDDETAAASGQGYAMTATGEPIGPIAHPLEHEAIHERHLNGQANAFFQSCVVARKSMMVEAGGYNMEFPAAEDFDMWHRLSSVGKLTNSPQVHLLYRVHPSSANFVLRDEQQRQGSVITNRYRAQAGLPNLPDLGQESMLPPKRDDWNRKIYWINIALQNGNPATASQLVFAAIARHPWSLLFWILLLVSSIDRLLFGGNRTSKFVPGEMPVLGELPWFSAFRLGRRAFRSLRRIRRGVA